MGVMTVMPRTGEEWTVDDLDRLPDDGLQYELLDGLLLATPAPVLVHLRAIGNLHLLLRAACPPSYEVFLSPVDWRPDRRTSLQAGVRSSWVVDPAEPSLLALDLQEGAYVTTASARGAERAALATPFPVDVVPAELVRPAP